MVAAAPTAVVAPHARRTRHPCAGVTGREQDVIDALAQARIEVRRLRGDGKIVSEAEQATIDREGVEWRSTPGRVPAWVR